MKAFLLILFSFVLLTIVPNAFAQDSHETIAEPTEGSFFYYPVAEGESLNWDELIARYGCPVGLRTFNRQTILNPDGLILAGQRLIILSEHPLCELDYSGEIFFLEWHNLPREFNPYLTDYWAGIDQIAVEFNVCTEAIQAINPGLAYLWEDTSWDGAISFRYISYLRIPVDSPECFEEFSRTGRIRELAQSLNVCEQVIWHYNRHQYTQREAKIAIPLERRACYENGRLLVDDSPLQRFQEQAYYVDVTVMPLGDARNLKEFAIQHHYCVQELYQLNVYAIESTSLQYEGFLEALQADDLVYVPVNAQSCIYLAESGKTVTEISQEYNVCLEALIALNHGDSRQESDDLSTWHHIRREGDPYFADSYWDGVFIPQNQPPCYDENGLRIGHNDRLVYETSRDDWLFKIAQENDVCIEDLLDGNELLRSYPITRMPSLIFIPDVPPCNDVQADGMIHYVASSMARYPDYHATQNIYSLSFIFNVCLNRIEAANPDLALIEWGNYPYDSPILIPAWHLPCYDYYIEMPQFGHYMFERSHASFSITQINYICYDKEIDPRTDYTGHEPVISPVEYRSDAYCYDLAANPYAIINNTSYVLYPFGFENLFVLADCFGVDPLEALQLTSDDDLHIYGYKHWAYWALPNPSRDCPFIGTDSQEVEAWYRRYRERTLYGELNDEGVYTVKTNDTLSAIGWRYGYLPEWIMAENNLPDAMIYSGQQLHLPDYPNLYQIAGYAGLGIGSISLFIGSSFVLRLRASRRKGKKKSDE